MKRMAILGAALSFVATTVVLLPGGPASAADCKTNTITTKVEAPGTVVTKYNGTCNDLNITYTKDGAGDGWDSYAGLYKSGGTWVTGSRGYKSLNDGNHGDFVVLSDVNSGTQMSVASLYDGGDTVKVKH